MKSQSWTVPADAVGKTVAAALKSLSGEYSWTQIKDFIRRRQIALNDVPCLDEARRVVADDRIELREQPFPGVPSDDAVKVYHLDDDFIVVEKPAGMVSLRHVAELDWPAARRREQSTLDEVVLRKLGALQRLDYDLSAKVAKDRRRYVRSVHRLDRETSGLVVFARTLKAETNLISQFAAHTIERVYLTVVPGEPTAQTLSSYFVRDRGDGLRGSTLDIADGKHARTFVRPLEKLGPYSLVECRLETGRTHQIRIHMTEAGFPVCGDPVYRNAFGQPPIEDQSGAPRLVLHAHRLEFTHPTSGNRLRFESPLSVDLEKFVTRWRG